MGVGSQLLFQYIDAMRQFPHQRRQFVDHRLPLFERAGLRWRLPDIDLHAVLDSTQRLSVSHHLARFSVSLLTCLVFSSQFHLEMLAPVVDSDFHPDTNSSGV